jgi:hypothetical protein
VSLSCYPRVQTSPIELSAEKYLGKYLSKGGGLIDDFIAAEGAESCPTAWWFMSQAMNDAVTSETAKGLDVGVLLDALVTSAFEDNSLDAFEWIRAVDMEVEGKRKTIGWCGRLRPGVGDDIRRLAGWGDGEGG